MIKPVTIINEIPLYDGDIQSLKLNHTAIFHLRYKTGVERWVWFHDRAGNLHNISTLEFKSSDSFDITGMVEGYCYWVRRELHSKYGNKYTVFRVLKCTGKKK